MKKSDFRAEYDFRDGVRGKHATAPSSTNLVGTKKDSTSKASRAPRPKPAQDKP